jgi:hypothetical protein
MAENFEDVVTSYRRNLEYNASDEDLLSAIERAINESSELKLKIDRIGENNQQYWQVGKRKDDIIIHPKKSKTTVNRIFTDIETSIPIITSETPEPTVLGDLTNEQKINIQKSLELAYDVKYKMQLKLQSFIRSWYLSRIGVMKYRWDKEKGFVTENVVTAKIGFDKRATSIDNCEYLWEEMEDNVENLVKKFPKKKEEIYQTVGDKKNSKSKIKYTEFWGGGSEWVCWKLNKIILDKKKNPNYDFENEENNLFESPQFPYLLLNVFNLGKDTSLYDSTSLIEECIPVQDGANGLEQQIYDLNEGRKRVWVAAGTAISEKKAQSLVNETGDLCVYLDRAEAAKDGLFQVQAGVPDAGMYNNLTHLLSEIDNIMGMHSTTRGERAQQETATGRQLLIGSDYGRLDLIVRNVEECIEDWFNALLQMIRIYSTEGLTVNDGENTYTLNADDIPTGTQIMVTKGSTLPTDEKTKRDNAIALAQMNMIDPATLFEEMGYPNVEERVQNLYQWLQSTGKIVPQQPQMPQGGTAGQEGAVPAPQGQTAPPQGGSPEQAKQQQLQRVQQIIQSPQFQQLPPAEQKQYIQQARQVVQAIKGG